MYKVEDVDYGFSSLARLVSPSGEILMESGRDTQSPLKVLGLLLNKVESMEATLKSGGIPVPQNIIEDVINCTSFVELAVLQDSLRAILERRT